MYKGKASKEQIDALLSMYERNKNIKKLITEFDLDIEGAIVAPLEKSDKNLITVNKIKNKKMAKGVTSKFKTEVGVPELAPFVKFENTGDVFEGVIIGTKVISMENNGVKADKTFFTAQDTDGNDCVLPSNVQLDIKIKNLVNIKGGIGELGIDVQITFLGKQKVEGYANAISQYKVLTT